MNEMGGGAAKDKEEGERGGREGVGEAVRRGARERVCVSWCGRDT